MLKHLMAIANFHSQPTDHNDLNNGFRLNEIPSNDVPKTLDSKSKTFYHLYKDGKKISDEIFRNGGMSNGFKDGFCVLIHYTEEEKYGSSCIVNEEGRIVLEADGMTHHIYHLKGVLASMKSQIFNLSTGKMIVPGYPHTMKSKEFLFVENSYNKDFKDGIYKISFKTGEYEVFE